MSSSELDKRYRCSPVVIDGGSPQVVYSATYAVCSYESVSHLQVRLCSMPVRTEWLGKRSLSKWFLKRSGVRKVLELVFI